MRRSSLQQSSGSTDRIGIECLSVFGMPPVQLIHLAADLDCQYVSTNLRPIRYDGDPYPEWSLRDDRTLRREMVAAMRERGVSISLGEGIGVRRRKDVRDYAGDLDLMSELGVERINVVSTEPDWSRSMDQFSELVDMADEAGIETTTEVGAGTLPDLATAVAAVRQVGKPTFRLLIDTMHYFRSGSRVEDIARIDPDTIAYVQLCDVPWKPSISDYMEEAMFERMVPGTGDLPLVGLLAALPRNLVVSIEVPIRSLALAGVGPRERMLRCVEATREVLERVDEEVWNPSKEER